VKAVEPTEGNKLVLMTKKSDLEVSRENDLFRLVRFFCDARIYNKVGDILLPHEARLEGLIDRHIDQYYKPKTEDEVREWRKSR
jgi:hypothetical protein